MPIIDAGLADHQCERVGNTSVSTTTTHFRSAVTSFALGMTQSSGTPGSHGWYRPIPDVSGEFWIQAYGNMSGFTLGTETAESHVMRLLTGTTRKYVINSVVGGGGGPLAFTFGKVDSAGTITTLGSSSVSIATSTVFRIAIHIIEGTSGRCRIYLDDVLSLDTGVVNMTTDVTGNVNRIKFGCRQNTSQTPVSYWSEFIVADEDTRALSVVYCPPSANGPTNEWTGAASNLGEITLNDSTLCSSATAGQILTAAINTSKLTGTPQVLAVVLSGRAQRGGTGPQKVAHGVRVSGTDYWGADKNLELSLQRVPEHVMNTNPATAGAWSADAIRAADFYIGLRSAA